MHPEAEMWVKHHAERLQRIRPFERVVEIGSLDINGSVRAAFNGAEYIGIDPQEGPGVDVVMDAADYEPDGPVDCVVCCETLEHAENWKELVRKGMSWLGDDGVFLITCAGPGRKPHSAVDGSHNVRDFEHYGNVSPADLAKELLPDFITEDSADVAIQVRQLGKDTQAVLFRRVVD